MKLQIFSFAYNFLISPPIFELLHLSMVLTYRNVTPHLGNLRGRILTHIVKLLALALTNLVTNLTKPSLVPDKIWARPPVNFSKLET